MENTYGSSFLLHPDECQSVSLRLGEAVIESCLFGFEIAPGADIIKSNAMLQPQQ